jgi:acyl carrier protein
MDTIRDYLISAEVPPDHIVGDVQLDELDIDSIDVVNILVDLQEQFGVVIQRTEVAEITLDGLVALAVERSSV